LKRGCIRRGVNWVCFGACDLIENHPFRSSCLWVMYMRHRRREAVVSLALYLPCLRNLVKPAPEQKPWNMNSISTWLGATGLAVYASFYPQETRANDFTGSDFLQWSEAQQLSYINAQLVMASSIVARDKPAMSQCVADTFFGDSGITDAKFRDVQSSVTSYATYHPSSILVVLIENACGKFY